MTDTLRGSDHLVVELSGRILKKYFESPKIVKNPPFGWFVELEPQSVKTMCSVADQLEDEDKRIIADFDLSIIQLIVYCDEGVKKCRDMQGKYISVKGKMSNPPCHFSPVHCYQLDLGYDLHIKEREQDFITDSMQEKTPFPQGFLVVEERCDMSSLKNPYSYVVDVANLSDDPLVLPEGAPEVLTMLKGKLILGLIPGHPEYCSIERGDYPSYCWFLQLDEPSFKTASTTPVWDLGLSRREIMEQPNWFEVQIGGDRQFEDFCCEHVNQEVSVQGYLFHAHTAHHHASLLMDVREFIGN